VRPVLPVVPGFALEVTTFAEYQERYDPLPSHCQPDGTVTTRWVLSWRERLLVAFGGSIWLQVLTFNELLQPVKLTAVCPIKGHTGHDEEV
jgi:hypothetical protein